MLGSASGSLPKYPGHPPAAYWGLVSLVPDLNSWPSEGARLRRAAAAWSKRYDPLLRHGVEGADGLGSLGYQTGTSEPKPDEHGRATWPDAQSSTPRSVCHDVLPFIHSLYHHTVMVVFT